MMMNTQKVKQFTDSVIATIKDSDDSEDAYFNMNYGVGYICALRDMGAITKEAKEVNVQILIKEAEKFN